MGVHELAALALSTLLAAGANLQLPEQRATVVAAEVAELTVGDKGELSLTLLEAPAVGFPLAVSIDQSPLTVRDRRLSWADVVDPLANQPRLSAPFVAPDVPGRFAVRATVSYVVCDAQRCEPRQARLSWDVAVVAEADAEPEPMVPSPAG
ncbi:MAG: hypothetical protein AAF721_18490 [Myxococcota bacterium]